ncbi:MAG: hypothetical protein HC801_01545, partial [Nitrospira sp.]|nr:hypothetical protein [Nitrospira sp.]
MTIAGTAVELVGAETSTHQLLEHIQFFVCAARRRQAGNGIGTVLALDLGHHRLPIMIAWSLPGMVLIIANDGAATMEEAVGAFLLAALLM